MVWNQIVLQEIGVTLYVIKKLSVNINFKTTKILYHMPLNKKKRRNFLIKHNSQKKFKLRSQLKIIRKMCDAYSSRCSWWRCWEIGSVQRTQVVYVNKSYILCIYYKYPYLAKRDFLSLKTTKNTRFSEFLTSKN